MYKEGILTRLSAKGTKEYQQFLCDHEDTRAKSAKNFIL